MYIKELESGTGINIEASNGFKTLTFETKVACPKDEDDLNRLEEVKKVKPYVKFTVLDPIRREDKLVNFVSEYVTSNLVAIVEGNKPFIWRNVSIVNMRLPKYGSVHIVFSVREAVSYNRRQHYRLTLDREGVIRIRTADHEKVYNVFVKDISESGVGFSIKGTQGLERGSGCIVEFSDSGQDFRIDVVVIRVQDNGNDRYTMGCKIRQRSAMVAKFINQKQKDRMKGADA